MIDQKYSFIADSAYIYTISIYIVHRREKVKQSSIHRASDDLITLCAFVPLRLRVKSFAYPPVIQNFYITCSQRDPLLTFDRHLYANLISATSIHLTMRSFGFLQFRA